MFDQLVESRPQGNRSPAQMMLSIMVHTAIVAVSVQLTRAAAATPDKQPVATEMLLTRPPAPIARTSTPTAVSRTAASSAPSLALPAPPLAVPTSIPPVDLGSKFNTSQFDVTGRRGPETMSLAADSALGDSRFIASLAQADDPAEYLEGPQPGYPPALRQVGVEGSVQLRYIVGIDGRAETGSITATRSTNTAFEAPAIEAIRLSRFRPAKIRGRVVRQLVEQVVRFTLGRPS